jgi:hypothetical protein
MLSGKSGLMMTIRRTKGTRMLARLLPWLVGLFVAAQIVATAHAAAFSDSKHTHDGHPCIISTVCKQASSADLAASAPALAAPEWHEHYSSHSEVDGEGLACVASSIRAPPVHL